MLIGLFHEMKAPSISSRCAWAQMVHFAAWRPGFALTPGEALPGFFFRFTGHLRRTSGTAPAAVRLAGSALRNAKQHLLLFLKRAPPDFSDPLLGSFGLWWE